MLPAGFLFALVGVLPCWGVLLPCRRPPALFACRLRGGSVLHFLFLGVISPGFIFLSSCARTVALCAVSVSLAWAYGVSRGPLWAVPVAEGLAYPPAGSPACGLWGPSWGGPGPGMAGGGQGVFSVGGPIFSGVCPDRSARASGWVRLPAPKSLGVKSRPRQPFSRPAGLNYSRSSSADNSAIFLLIDSFFCAATKSKVDEAYSPFSPSTIVAPLPLTSSRYFFRRSSAEAASPSALFGVRTTSCWSFMP